MLSDESYAHSAARLRRIFRALQARNYRLYFGGQSLSLSGVGAIIGALYLASRDSVLGLGRVLVLSTGLFGLGLVGLSFARHEVVAGLALVGASGGMIVLTTASNTVLQTIVDEEKRGRIISLYPTAFMGMAPIGSLVAGGVAA